MTMYAREVVMSQITIRTNTQWLLIYRFWFCNTCAFTVYYSNAHMVQSQHISCINFSCSLGLIFVYNERRTKKIGTSIVRFLYNVVKYKIIFSVRRCVFFLSNFFIDSSSYSWNRFKHTVKTWKCVFLSWKANIDFHHVDFLIK